MNHFTTFIAHVLRVGQWSIVFSSEFPEESGQGPTEVEALESLRLSILLLMEDRREGARANLGKCEKLVSLAVA